MSTATSSSSSSSSTSNSSTILSQDPNKELFNACRNGDLIKVEKLVNTSNVNIRDTNGRKSTPLHFAAGFGRKDIVEYLLLTGGNVHAKDEGGLVPLHNACSFGHAEVVQMLLKHNADPNARDNWNFTPLHEAAIKGKVEVCIVLLQSGADSGVKNADGKTPHDLADPAAKAVLNGSYRKEELLEAARTGNEEKLMSLLTPLNVNCHASDGRKSTPLHLAAGYNRARIVQLLIQFGADVHAKDKGGLVPLHNACSYGHFEVTEMLIKAGACVNATDLWQFTPLHEAASKVRIEVCSLLLSHKADPYLTNCYDKNALEIAPNEELQERIQLEFKGYSLLDAVMNGEFTKVKKFLSLDTINFKHIFTGDTPLHCVILSNHPKRKQIAEILIKKGVNLNEKNRDFLSPLHLAADKSQHDLLELFLKHGAKVNILDALGQTALHRCAREGNLHSCQILLSYGVDTSIVSLQGFTADQVAKENIQKLLLNHKLTATGHAEYKLLESSKAGELDSVKAILDTHPHLVNCRDIDGRPHMITKFVF